MKVFSIKRITKRADLLVLDILFKNYYAPETKVYLCMFGKKIKLIYHYGIRYKEWVILGATHGIKAATTCIDDKVEGKYMFTNLLNS